MQHLLHSLEKMQSWLVADHMDPQYLVKAKCHYNITAVKA